MSNDLIPGRIHSIETFGSLDGPGIRYVAFLQGCPFRCVYCHNPDTWILDSGKQISAEDLVADMLRYRSFIESGGVTLSGGEPLLQADFCLDVLHLCKTVGLHTAIDTSGGIPLALSRTCIDQADLLLLDLKAFDADLCRKITGQDNRNAMETLNYCEQTGRSVWLRHVVVPGLTMDLILLEKMAKYLNHFSCIKKVELLPFHKMGAFKWEQLEIPFTLQSTPQPTAEELQKVKDIFSAYGLPIT